MSSTPVYMDYQATTPGDERVEAAMRPWFSAYTGNASSTHAHGRAAMAAWEESLRRIASFVGGSPDDYVVTSGATESNNLAIIGACTALGPRSAVICSPTEHESVLRVVDALRGRGHAVRWLEVDRDGSPSLPSLRRRISEVPHGVPIVVSVMLANNEIGTVAPIRAMFDVARSAASRRGAKVLLHTDASQGAGRVPDDAWHGEDGRPLADLVSISGHKIYAPVGVGALYIAPGTPLAARQYGGGQQGGRRSGTLPVALAVGLGEACEIMRREGPAESERVGALRDMLAELLMAGSDDALTVNGSWPPTPYTRSPANLNISLEGVCPIALARYLGPVVSYSSASACSAGDAAVDPFKQSYVLRAIRALEPQSAASVRLGLGRWTTEREVLVVAEAISSAVRELRGMGCPLEQRRRTESDG